MSEAEAILSTSVTAQKTADMRLKHLRKEVKDAEKKLDDVRKSSKSEVCSNPSRRAWHQHTNPRKT